MNSSNESISKGVYTSPTPTVAVRKPTHSSEKVQTQQKQKIIKKKLFKRRQKNCSKPFFLPKHPHKIQVWL